MMKSLRYLLMPALVLAIAIPVMAAGKEKREGKNIIYELTAEGKMVFKASRDRFCRIFTGVYK